METVTSADGTTIAFERSGDGPPVILIGGALGDRATAEPLADLLAPRFSAIAYDRRGRGDSGDATPFSVDRELDDIDALIGQAGGSACLFGHSSGAALAIRATARGSGVARLALYEPPFIVDDSRRPVAAEYADRLEELVAAGDRGDAVAYFMTEGPGVSDDVVEQMRSSPAWPAFEVLAHTLSYDARVMEGTMSGQPLPAEWSGSITVPTLVMVGGASPPWQQTSVLTLVELLPNAELRTLEGQEHGPPPELVAPVLTEFFAS